MMRRRILACLAMAGWCLVWITADGCARRSGPVEQGAGVGQPGGTTPAPAGPLAAVDTDQNIAADVAAAGSVAQTEGPADVFFGFDSWLVSPDARRSLDRTAQWLKEADDRRVVIEGHADERGTNEYNIALGERRAQAAKRYLVASGIDAQRLQVVSFGEERPFCREREERCWRENRRGHFVSK